MQDTMTELSESNRTSFYRAAIAGLAALEQQVDNPYYTGSERSSQWSLFAGHLDAADRLDLVIRDAAVRQPAAFAPRDVFRLLDLPDDEPFGPAWSSPYGRDSGKVAWRSLEGSLDKSATDLWAEAVSSWGLEPAPATTEPIGEAERVVLVGWPAICGAAQAMFAANQSEWSPRVLLAIAESPGARQLAGLAGVLLGDAANQKARIAAPSEIPGVASEGDTQPEDLASWLGGRPDRVIASARLTDTEQRVADLLG